LFNDINLKKLEINLIVARKRNIKEMIFGELSALGGARN
jgi:hypothetical protein